MDGVFGVFLPRGEDQLTAEEQALFDERQDARKRRDFAAADAARERARGPGHRPRGHGQGHALAAEGGERSSPACVRGPAPAARRARSLACRASLAGRARDPRPQLPLPRRRGRPRGPRRRTARCFVEVKERRTATHGEGYEAVTFGKRRRIVRAARLYAVAARPLRSAPPLRRGVDRLARATQPAGPPRPRRFDSDGR